MNQTTLTPKLEKWLRTACSKDQLRPVLAIVADDQTTDVRTLVTTDSHRLHGIYLEPCEPVVTVLPKKRKNSYFTPYASAFDYATGENPQDGTFPNWQRVVPDAGMGSRLTVDVAALLDALKKLRITGDKVDRLIVTMGFETLTLQMRQGLELVGEPVKVPCTSHALGELAINRRCLADALKGFSGKCDIYVTDPTRPLLFKPEGVTWQEGPFAVIMPMSLFG